MRFSKDVASGENNSSESAIHNKENLAIGRLAAYDGSKERTPWRSVCHLRQSQPENH
jgi:hypothetical protein